MLRIGMRRQTFGVIAVVALSGSVAVTGDANAQPDQVRDSATMNFDLWCQEEAHLPPERCDKRTAADEIAFEAHRNSAEHEADAHPTESSQAVINQDIMNSDPRDNPQKADLGPQQGIIPPN